MIRRIQIYFLILICLLVSFAYAGESDNYSWELREGKFVKVTTKITESIEIVGKIKWFADTEQGIFYIKSVEHKGPDDSIDIGYLVGLVDKKENKISFEKELPFKGVLTIKKGLVKGNNLHVIVQNGSSWLYTIDYTTLEITKDENVCDFEIIHDRFYYVKSDAGSYFFISGREKIPLNLKGTITLKSIIHARLVWLESAEGVELVDLKKMKNIYLFSSKTDYVLPDSHNLVVEAIDQSEKIDAQNFVFYKVFIDGIEKGRTSTGLSQITKSFKEKIDTGNHIIQLERWRLHKAQKRYRRENNIVQPEPFKLYIPENRIIKIKLFYDGVKHHMEKIIVYE